MSAQQGINADQIALSVVEGRLDVIGANYHLLCNRQQKGLNLHKPNIIPRTNEEDCFKIKESVSKSVLSEPNQASQQRSIKFLQTLNKISANRWKSRQLLPRIKPCRKRGMEHSQIGQKFDSKLTLNRSSNQFVPSATLIKRYHWPSVEDSIQVIVVPVDDNQ